MASLLAQTIRYLFTFVASAVSRISVRAYDVFVCRRKRNLTFVPALKGSPSFSFYIELV